jgi:hypothetical protein
MTASTKEAGTKRAPRYHDAIDESHGDIRLHTRLFTYRDELGLVVGNRTSVTFTLDALAHDVWPFASDHNTWQNPFDHYYSGVLGDLEGKTFALTDTPDDTDHPHAYQVIKVMPEYLIVVEQPVLSEAEHQRYGLPGFAGVSPGFHVFMLAEHGGKTEMNVLMEHATIAARPSDPPMTEEEALAPWLDESMVPEWHRKWRDDFIPLFKKLVAGGTR